MATTFKTVRARLDAPSARALQMLTSQGHTESEAVRGALVAAAERARRRSALTDEARRLAADPVDTAERRSVMRDMDALAPGIVE